MTAALIYPLVQSLKISEQKKLLDMLQKDLIDFEKPNPKKPVITDAEAKAYLRKALKIK